MTLGIVCVSQQRVFHVCDRRVTKADSGELFSDTENKSLILLADNGVLSISYTGPAFLRTQGTDFWIADTIAGRTFDPSWSHVPFEAVTIRADLAVWKLVDALRKRIKRNPSLRSQALKIVASGYIRPKRTRGLIRPICYEIVKKRASDDVAVKGTSYARSLRYLNREFDLIFAPEGWLSENQYALLCSDLARSQSIEEIEKHLVSAVRMVSDSVKQVGGDVMSIQIPHIGTGSKIGVKFHPLAPHSVSFTPWLLQKNYAHMPFQFQHRSGLKIDLGCIEMSSATPWTDPPKIKLGDTSLSPVFVSSPMPKRF